MANPQFSVLVPLEDARGSAAEHIRTWTHGQQFPRERFQAVVVSNGANPRAEREVAQLLEPQDVLAHADTDHVVGLWREASRRARAPWLVLTEAHCEADPGCLAATAHALEVEPDIDAAMFTHGHVTQSAPAELTARWFRHCYAEWSRSEWPHLNLVGAAVRREIFCEIDVFDPRYGLFCAPLLSARLHARGAKVAEVRDAVVNHVYHDTLAEHHEHSADAARGECEARSSLDEAFCDRYFGRSELWSARLRYRPALARQMTRALRAQIQRTIERGAGGRRKQEAGPEEHSRADLAWLARELAAWLPASLAGVRPRAAAERLGFHASQIAAERMPFATERRWRSYLRAQERIVRSTHLSWIDDHVRALPPPPRQTGAWSIEQLDAYALVGAHAREHRDDGWFCWTDPAAMLRLLPPRGAHVLRIDTHGMRGAPLAYLAGVYLGGRALPADALHDDGERLIVELPADIDPTVDGVALLCRPLQPHKDGSPDMRRLGMPVFSVELEPTG